VSKGEKRASGETPRNRKENVTTISSNFLEGWTRRP
jgi:hypothetical protein